MNLRIVGSNRLANALQNGSLTCLWRRDNQTTLTLTNRSHQINCAASNGVFTVLHCKRLIWENRSQIFEARTVLKTLNFPTVNLGNLKKWWIFAIYTSRSNHAQDAIARTQAKISNNLLVDKGVVIAFHVITCTNPTVAFVANLKNTLNSLKALNSCRCSIHKLNQIRLMNTCILNAQLSCFSTKLRKLHLLQSLFGKRWLACLALLAILVALVVLSTIARRTLLVVSVSVFLCLLALLSRFFWLSITMSTTCCACTCAS